MTDMTWELQFTFKIWNIMWSVFIWHMSVNIRGWSPGHKAEGTTKKQKQLLISQPVLNANSVTQSAVNSAIANMLVGTLLLLLIFVVVREFKELIIATCYVTAHYMLFSWMRQQWQRSWFHCLHHNYKWLLVSVVREVISGSDGALDRCWYTAVTICIPVTTCLNGSRRSGIWNGWRARKIRHLKENRPHN